VAHSAARHGTKDSTWASGAPGVLMTRKPDFSYAASVHRAHHVAMPCAVVGLLLLACGASKDAAEQVESAQRADSSPVQVEKAQVEPPCARADGYLHVLDYHEPPAGFESGHDLVQDVLPLDPRLVFRIDGEPVLEDGSLGVSATLTNPSEERVELDVITGGVSGLSSLPFTLQFVPPLRARAGLGQESFSAPEVYPGPIRWTLPPRSELRLTASVCVARYELTPGQTIGIRWALQTASEPMPQGTLEVTVPQ
jgi:hypothetical protein